VLAGYEGLAEHLLLFFLLLLLLHAEQQMVLHLPYSKVTSEWRVLPANLAWQLGHTNSMPMVGSLWCEDYCEVSLFFSRLTLPPIEFPILQKYIIKTRSKAEERIPQGWPGAEGAGTQGLGLELEAERERKRSRNYAEFLRILFITI